MEANCEASSGLHYVCRFKQSTRFFPLSSVASCLTCPGTERRSTPIRACPRNMSPRLVSTRDALRPTFIVDSVITKTALEDHRIAEGVLGSVANYLALYTQGPPEYSSASVDPRRPHQGTHKNREMTSRLGDRAQSIVRAHTDACVSMD